MTIKASNICITEIGQRMHLYLMERNRNTKILIRQVQIITKIEMILILGLLVIIEELKIRNQIGNKVVIHKGKRTVVIKMMIYGKMWKEQSNKQNTRSVKLEWNHMTLSHLKAPLNKVMRKSKHKISNLTSILMDNKQVILEIKEDRIRLQR